MEEILKKLELVKLEDGSLRDNAEEDVESKIQLEKEIRESLSSSETTTKWLQSSSITKEELEEYYQMFQEEFDELEANKCQNEMELRFTVVECIAKACLMAQILVNKKNPEKYGIDVNNFVDSAREFITRGETRGYFHQDYSDGFRFVVKCLEIGAMDLPKVDVEKLNRLLDFVHVESSNLATKAHVGVLALKQYVIGNLCRRNHNSQIEILKQMIREDPDNPEWHLCYYLVNKFKRESTDQFSAPSEVEKQAILSAMRCHDGDLNPRVLLAYVEALANMFRSAHRSRNFVGCHFGDRSFYSMHEIVDYIGEQAQQILCIDPTSVRCNVNLAKIASSVLPREFRENMYAEMCLKRVLLFHPRSSKANHRMGVLHISMGRPERAYRYLKDAYLRDRRNFFALNDLLNILMADVFSNFHEINEILETVNISYWLREPHKYGRLHFVHALYYMLSGKNSEAADKLLQAFRVYPEVTELFKQDLATRVRNFSWNSNMYASNILGSILSLLREAIHNCDDEDNKKDYLSMYAKAINAERYMDDYANRRGGRGRGRGRGGRGSTRGGIWSSATAGGNRDSPRGPASPGRRSSSGRKAFERGTYTQFRSGRSTPFGRNFSFNEETASPIDRSYERQRPGGNTNSLQSSNKSGDASVENDSRGKSENRRGGRMGSFSPRNTSRGRLQVGSDSPNRRTDCHSSGEASPTRSVSPLPSWGNSRATSPTPSEVSVSSELNYRSGDIRSSWFRRSSRRQGNSPLDDFNPRSILGVGETATVAEIQRAFRSIALQYQAEEEFGDPKKARQMVEKMKILNQAYETLLLSMQR